MIRPQMKKQKELSSMLADLKNGDKVVAAGGIVGTIVKFEDNLARKFDKKLIYKNVKYIGNTTSSSIPISIKLALKSKEITKGDDLLLCGFGVGLSISIVSVKI